MWITSSCDGSCGYFWNRLRSSFDSANNANGFLIPAADTVPGLDIAVDWGGDADSGFGAREGEIGGWVALCMVEHATEQLGLSVATI